MLDHIDIYDLIFVDIETVPGYSSHSHLSDAMKEMWASKYLFFKGENDTSEEGYLKRAGVFAEFAKIVCISIGYFKTDKQSNRRTFRIKSFSGDDEKTLLSEFTQLISTAFDSGRYHFCGHNIREFDIPFLCRRMLINGVELPAMLDISGKKPWETFDVDTMQLWKFGDFKHYTSLRLLCEIMNVPTPKDAIDGKDVCRVYWQEQGLDRIVTYCQKDIVAVARLLLKFKGDTSELSDADVIITTEPNAAVT